MNTAEAVESLNGLRSHDSKSELDDFHDTETVSSDDAQGVKFNEYSVCAFAVTVVIGGHYYGWNSFLQYGFGMCAASQFLIIAAYIVYVCSIAEIVSGFPFSGGCYGLARVSQGYYVGFLVGCCEALEYIAYSAMSFIYISNLLCSLFQIDSQYSIVFCFLCYVLAVIITLYGGKMVVYTNYILAVVSILILLVFCFGTMHWTNFIENASLHLNPSDANMSNWFSGGIVQFLSTIPDTSCFYGGIEALCLLPSYTKDPKISIPRGLLLGMAVLFCSNMLVLFVFPSMPGGILAISEMDLPMQVGFKLMFNCTRAGTILLMIPAQFGMGFGFVLPYAKLLQALGTTNLLPSVLRLNHCKDHRMAVIVGSIFGFALSVMSEYFEGKHLPHFCILAGFLTYLSQLHGYYLLKTRYATSKREFTSPFGIAGIVFAGVVFLLGIIAIAFFSHSFTAAVFVGGYLILLSVYYHGFAAKTQTIAKEEQAVLFQLHVANHNRNRRKHRPHTHNSPGRGGVGMLARGVSVRKILPSGADSDNNSQHRPGGRHSVVSSVTLSGVVAPTCEESADTSPITTGEAAVVSHAPTRHSYAEVESMDEENQIPLFDVAAANEHKKGSV